MRRLRSEVLDAGTGSKRGREGLIHIASIDWDWLWARQQQLTTRLARTRRVLFVERMLSLDSLVRRRRFLRKVAENVWTLSPVKVLPFESKSRLTRAGNRILYAAAVRAASSRIGMRNPVLFFSTFDDHDLPGRLPHSLIVYDCLDRHEAFSWAQGSELAAETRLLRQADVVVASSRDLVDRLAEMGVDAVLLRNAADVAFLGTAREQGEVLPALREIARPRIGFVGYIADWVDLDLLDYVARERPQWNIVLAGKRNVPDHSVFHRQNVWFLGPIPYPELPSLLRGLDVCLVPFKKNALTKAADTIKLFEYLSAGKRVVSTDVEQAKEFSRFVSVAATPEEFLRDIEDLLGRGPLTPTPELESLLKGFDWDARVQRLNELFENALRQRSPAPT